MSHQYLVINIQTILIKINICVSQAHQFYIS